MTIDVCYIINVSFQRKLTRMVHFICAFIKYFVCGTAVPHICCLAISWDISMAPCTEAKAVYRVEQKP